MEFNPTYRAKLKVNYLEELDKLNGFGRQETPPPWRRRPTGGQMPLENVRHWGMLTGKSSQDKGQGKGARIHLPSLRY